LLKALTTGRFNCCATHRLSVIPASIASFAHWTSGVVGIDPIAGFDIDQITANRPDRFLDELLAALPTDPFENDRSRYCSAISAAVGKLPQWGMDLVQVLISRNLQDRDLWVAICFGWSNANLSPQDWKLVLDLAETIDAPADFFEGFVEVLGLGARREQHRIPNELIEGAQRVAERIWARALESSSPEEEDEAEWFASAINQPGGKLAEFWLWSISVVREVVGDSWTGVPTGIRDHLLRILKGSSEASGYARTIFASGLHHLFTMDPSFAEERLLPLFDWQANEAAAEQCWNGFLHAGRWLPGLLAGLLPLFNATVAKIEGIPDRMQEILVTHIATLALYFMEDPFANEWLPHIAQKLTDENLIWLAEAIDRSLDDMDTALGETKWERWLLRYWKLRQIGIPQPLSLKEGDVLACWALSVGKQFPEAVEMIKSIRIAAAFGYTAFFYRLRKKQLAKAYPKATADLVLHCLRSTRDHFAVWMQLVDIWNDLREAKVSAGTLDAIRGEALRLGIDLVVQ
jgi:hypothetical protein